MLLGELGNSQERGVPASGAVDQSSFDFWTQDVRNPDSGGPGTRAIGSAPRASFVYYDERAGFVAGSDIGDEGLRDRGDLDIVVNVDHVRPSLADQGRGTAWGKLQSVPLPSGGGRWTWNFFLQRRKGRWMQILEAIRRNRGLLAPIFGLGFPAIAITALTTVDSIVAEMTKDERTDWLFQSPDVYFYATKYARDSIEGSKLRLKKGMYVIMPSDRLSAFGKEQSRLMIKDGLIVPKNTTGLDVESAAREVIPDITYLTVGVTSKFRPTSR